MADARAVRSLRDRVLLLRSTPAFGALDDESLTLFAEHGHTASFRAGETLLREGRPVDAVHLVIEGQVTSMRHGKRVAVVRAMRGVGFLSLMARDDHGVDATADVDTTTLAIPAEAVQDALEESFPLVRNALRNSAGGLVDRRQKLPVDPDNPPPLVEAPMPTEPRTLAEHVLGTRGGGIFARSNLEAVVAVARSVEEVRFAAGTELWNLGDASTAWYRIESGRVRCTSPEGRSVDVGHRFVVGMMDALAARPRAFAARAETPLLVYRQDLEPFLAILEAHFELARELLAVLARANLATPEREP